MNSNQDHTNEVLALMLDVQDRGEAFAAARERLLQDPELRREADDLLAFAARLTALGEAVHSDLPAINLIDDIRDSIAHLAAEELAVVHESPFGAIEQALAGLKGDFDAAAGSISLVDDVMAAVAASRMTDEEVELPYLRETERLRALGNAIAENAPPVDLIEPVSAEVGRRYATPMVPLRARPAVAPAVRVPAARQSWSSTMGFAAAALLCLGGAWFAFQYLIGAPSSAPVDTTANKNGTEEAGAGPSTAPVFFKIPDKSDVDTMASRTGESENPEKATGAGLPKEEPLTLQEVINAARSDLVNDTRAIAALSSMSPEEAIALLKEMDLSIEALIGATQFLSPDEALAVLRAAVEKHPDDPQLRYALAQNLGTNPETLDERMAQLNQMAAKDPVNGLPHYMLASDYLARGETDLALDALTRGSGHAESSAYTLEAARQREAAYIANGMEPDVARLLALSSAGASEYGDIAALRNELLDYGAYYEELGDTDTAQQIYNAVNELGRQLAFGAEMAVERQYGLETQQEAVLAIQGITDLLQDPQVTAWIGDTLGFLATSLAEVGQYIEASQELLIDPSFGERIDWEGYLQHVILHGDMNITDFLP